MPSVGTSDAEVCNSDVSEAGATIFDFLAIGSTDGKAEDVETAASSKSVVGVAVADFSSSDDELVLDGGKFNRSRRTTEAKSREG